MDFKSSPSIRLHLIAAIMLCLCGCHHPTPVTPKDLFLIDYANVRHGILYHGTLSDNDGAVQATWTFEQNSQKGGTVLGGHIDVTVPYPNSLP